MKVRYRLYHYFLLTISLFLIINAIALIFTSALNFGVILEGCLGITIISIIFLFKNTNLFSRNRNLKKYFAITVIIISIVAFSILTPVIYHGLPQKTQEADYVIILGAGLRGDTVTWALQERLNAGITYLNHYPDAQVVVTGGKGVGEEISEAEAMERYLIEHGVAIYRIIKETAATSTYENLLYSKNILDNIYGDGIKKVVIITNDFHMFRAKLLAERNDLSPMGLPCPTPWPIIISSYLRETLAVVKSIIFDR